MSIDWIIVSQIAGPVIGVLVGASIHRALSEREKLIAHYGHVASHTLKAKVQGREDTQINTHTVIIRNNGNKTATNVRMSHNGQIPDIRIDPVTEYKVNNLPQGAQEIVIPRVTPKMEYTISYLYFPPITYNLIQTSIVSDAGPAKIVNVRLQPIYPQWVNRLIILDMLLGIIAFIYIAFELGRYALSIM